MKIILEIGSCAATNVEEFFIREYDAHKWQLITQYIGQKMRIHFRA
jgi:hypothetical protein